MFLHAHKQSVFYVPIKLRKLIEGNFDILKKVIASLVLVVIEAAAAAAAAAAA